MLLDRLNFIQDVQECISFPNRGTILELEYRAVIHRIPYTYYDSVIRLLRGNGQMVFSLRGGGDLNSSRSVHAFSMSTYSLIIEDKRMEFQLRIFYIAIQKQAL